MKFTMPILALVVALLFVASQSVYTVDQRKYAIKFQLGEVVETKTDGRVSTSRCRWCRTSSSTTRCNLTLDNPEPDRMTTSEKKPLLVDFVVLWRIIDVRQYYISVQGDEEAARRRLSQTVRANLAEEFNKHDVHEAISSARDTITTVTQQKAERRREVDRRRGHRRAAAPRRAAARRDRSRLPADGIRAPARGERVALARRRRIGEDPRRRRPAARR